MRKFLVTALLVFGAAAADPDLCLQFCEPCKDAPPEDATCASVFSICQCEELLKSVEPAPEEAPVEEANEAEVAEPETEPAASEPEVQLSELDFKRRELVGNSLYEAASAGKFSARFWFSNDSLKDFTIGEVAGVSVVAEPRLGSFPNECVGLCKMASENDPANPMVAQIESTCGCSKRVQDSLAIIDFRNARVENAGLAADSVVGFCSGLKVCRAELYLNPENYSVASIERLPDPKPDSAALARVALKESRLDSLEDVLYDNCFSGRCKINIQFYDELFEQTARVNEGKERISEPMVRTLAGKCLELCNALPNDPTNPMVAQIESSCGCVEHVQDSVRLAEFRSVRDSNVSLAADSIVAACFERERCDVEVSLDETTFKLLSLNLAAAPAVAEPKNDSAGAPREKSKNELDKTRYFGVSLYGGGFSAEYENGKYELKWDGDGGFEIGLGAFFRWYFYEYGSLQTGLNVAYSYVDLGSEYYGFTVLPTASGDYVDTYLFDYELKSHKVSAEIPLQVRVGVPYVYATFAFTVRKPVWELLDFDGSALASSGSVGGMRGFGSWEFLGHVGGGLEYDRWLSLEALFGVFDLSTEDEAVEQSFSWKLKFDITL